MEASNEIKSAVNNIKYYSNQIAELARKQIDRDVTNGNLLGISIEPGTLRFDSLGSISAASDWIDTYCENILSNVRNAELLDSKLRVPKEKKE